MADLTRALDLSPGPLGLALVVGASASILAMVSLGWTADRLGRRAFLMVTGCVIGFGIAGLALAGGYVALLLTLIVLYSASGLYVRLLRGLLRLGYQILVALAIPSPLFVIALPKG